MKSMIRVLVLGATGRSGNFLIKELVSQENVEIVAAIRKETDTLRLPPIKANLLQAKLVNYQHLEASAHLLNDADVIVNALRLEEKSTNPILHEDTLVTFDQHLRTLLVNKSKKIISIGGAGALNFSTTKKVWQLDTFPTKTLPRGRAQANLRKYLEGLSKTDKWSYLVPPLVYAAKGIRTGNYRTFAPAEIERFFINNTISYADFALPSRMLS